MTLRKTFRPEAAISLDFFDFKRDIWDNFDVSICINAIYNIGYSDKLIGRVLFAALCAYFISKSGKSLIRSAICEAIIKIMIHYERSPEGQLNFILTDFYMTIYKPLGGAKLFRAGTRKISLRKWLNSHRKQIFSINTMIEIAHFADAYLNDSTQYARPSTLNCKEFAYDIDPEGHPAVSTLSIYWSKRNKKSSLLYASQCMTIGNKIFLEKILDGNFYFYKHYDIFEELISRSTYINENIIKKTFDIKVYEANKLYYISQFTSIALGEVRFDFRQRNQLTKRFALS